MNGWVVVVVIVIDIVNIILSWTDRIHLISIVGRIIIQWEVIGLDDLTTATVVKRAIRNSIIIIIISWSYAIIVVVIRKSIGVIEAYWVIEGIERTNIIIVIIIVVVTILIATTTRIVVASCVISKGAI